MKKLNILEIGTNDIKGGAAQVSWLLKKEMEKQGHSVTMAVGDKKSLDPMVKNVFDSSVNNFVSKLIGRNFYQRLTYHISYWMADDTFIPLAKRVSKTPEFINADIINAHNLHSNFFNLKELTTISSSKPFVWTLHDMWALTGHNSYSFECEHWIKGGCSCVLPDSIPAHRWNNSTYLWNKKKNIYDCSKIQLVVPSRWLYDLVKISILKNFPIHLIYNGIDSETYTPSDKSLSRLKLGLPEDKIIILFASKAGKKYTRKGWEYAQQLINHTAHNENVMFICLGGSEDESISPRLKFLPFTNDQSIISLYYSASDILVFPSLAENCPLTILEAMACGLPVLAFNIGGIPELVQHRQTGYVAESKNTVDFIIGFNWLLNLSDENRKKMSGACRKIILEKFTSRQMADNYLRLYNSLLKP